MKIEKRLDLGIGVIEFTKNIAMGYVNPSVNFDDKERKAFLEACLKHFDGKHFGYISVRKHSYSINPLIYMQLNTVESLKAFAIVPFSKLSKDIAKIEGKFYHNPFGIFDDLEEAVKWMEEKIEEAS
mgnify:CR=1 FL=1